MIARLLASICKLGRLAPLGWRYGDLRETPLPLRLLVRTDTYHDIVHWLNEQEDSLRSRIEQSVVAIVCPLPGSGIGSTASNTDGIEVHCVDILRDNGRGAWLEPAANTQCYGIPLFVTPDVPPGRVYLVPPPDLKN